MVGWTLFFRTALIYVVIYIGMRIMGKREIGKLSLMDFVIYILIAEIAAFVIEDVSKPLTDVLIPIATLVMIEVLLAIVSLRSRKLRTWLDGEPTYIIRGGKLDREQMRKQRYNLDDLMMQLRENRINSIADVEFAVLETSGKLTVVEKPKQAKQSHPTLVNEHDTIRFETLPVPLIMDGKVQDDQLQKLGKTRFWLKNELHARGIREFKDVFFCSVDHRGRLFIDRQKR